MKHAKAFLFPSFYEGFGIPPLEAMYLGTPVIISDIPVYKEVYKDLPVTFFRTGDVQDLYLKLRGFVSKPLDVSEKIDKMYNYAATAKNILSIIERSINV
jgi:glycosyltransferase involved in cell wall biosynthesis